MDRIDTNEAGCQRFMKILKKAIFNIDAPLELSIDGRLEFIEKKTKQFIKNQGVNYRISFAYFARFNGRTELAEPAKLLLMKNFDANGD